MVLQNVNIVIIIEDIDGIQEHGIPILGEPLDYRGKMFDLRSYAIEATLISERPYGVKRQTMSLTKHQAEGICSSAALGSILLT